MKRKYVILFFFLLGTLFPSSIVAQEINEEPGGSGVTKPEPFYRYNAEGGIQIAYPIKDGAFKQNFVGIYSFDGAITAGITKRFYAGIDLHYCQFATAVNPKYDTIKTQMIDYLGGIRLGYHSSLVNTFVFNGTLSGGEGLVTYNSVPVVAPKGYNQQTTYFNITLAENYNASEGIIVGFQLSYTYLTYNFNPDNIGFQHFYNYNNSDKQGPTTFISWGFQIMYCFGKKKGG